MRPHPLTAPARPGVIASQPLNTAFILHHCKLCSERNVLDGCVFAVVIVEFNDGELKNHRFCEWFDIHDKGLTIYAYAMMMEPRLQNVDFGLYMLDVGQSPGEFRGKNHKHISSQLKYFDPNQQISKQIGLHGRISLRVSAESYRVLPIGSKLLNEMKEKYK